MAFYKPLYCTSAAKLTNRLIYWHHLSKESTAAVSMSGSVFNRSAFFLEGIICSFFFLFCSLSPPKDPQWWFILEFPTTSPPTHTHASFCISSKFLCWFSSIMWYVGMFYHGMKAVGHLDRNETSVDHFTDNSLKLFCSFGNYLMYIGTVFRNELMVH